MRNGKILNEDHCEDVASKYQAVGCLNIQTLPHHVMHHKNGSIIQLVNDNHINCLGLAETNLY